MLELHIYITEAVTVAVTFCYITTRNERGGDKTEAVIRCNVMEAVTFGETVSRFFWSRNGSVPCGYVMVAVTFRYVTTYPEFVTFSYVTTVNSQLSRSGDLGLVFLIWESCLKW